jgi:hypothetical protein
MTALTRSGESAVSWSKLMATGLTVWEDLRLGERRARRCFPLPNVHVGEPTGQLPRKPISFSQALRGLVRAPEDLFDRWYYSYDKRLDQRRARAARADPVGARLQDHLDRSGALSPENWEVYRRIVDPVAPDRWPTTLHDWLANHGPEHQYAKVEAVVQRSRRGYADTDVYDLHWYLSGVIAASVRRLDEVTIAYPGPGTEWPEPEDWAAALADLAGRFERLSLQDYEAVEPGGDVEVDEAFALLRKMWFHMWD